MLVSSAGAKQCSAPRAPFCLFPSSPRAQSMVHPSSASSPHGRPGRGDPLSRGPRATRPAGDPPSSKLIVPTYKLIVAIFSSEGGDPPSSKLIVPTYKLIVATFSSEGRGPTPRKRCSCRAPLSGGGSPRGSPSSKLIVPTYKLIVAIFSSEGGGPHPPKAVLVSSAAFGGWVPPPRPRF